MAQQHELDLLRMLEEVLSAEKKDAARIIEHFHECRNLGIEILPLDINRSGLSCAFERNQVLRLGFSALGYRDAQFLEELLNERQANEAFQSFQDFCERVDTEQFPEPFLGQSIKAGLFDSLDEPRAKLLNGFEMISQAVRKAKADRAANQISLFAMMPAASQGQALSVKLPDVEAWSEELRIEHEKEALGFSFTEYFIQLEELSQEDAKDVEAIRETEVVQISDDRERDVPPPSAAPVDADRKNAAPVESLLDDGENAKAERESIMLSETQKPEAEPEPVEPESPPSPSQSDEVPPTALSLRKEVEAENDGMPDDLQEPPWPDEGYLEAEEVSGGTFAQHALNDEEPSTSDASEAASDPAEDGAEKKDARTLCLRVPLQSVKEPRLMKLRECCVRNPGNRPLLLEFTDENGSCMKVQAHPKYSILDSTEFRQQIQALFEGLVEFFDSAILD